MDQSLLRRIVLASGGQPDRNDSENFLLREWLGIVSPPEPTPEPPEPPIDDMLHQISVTLNQGEIIASHSAPIQVVAATESLGYVGMPVRIPIIVAGAITWDVYEGTPYGNLPGGSNLGLYYGSDAGNTIMQLEPTVTMTQGQFGPLLGVNANGYVLASQNLRDSIEDNAIFFSIFNNFSGDLTGGHASNVLRISITYLILNLQTGLFE